MYSQAVTHPSTNLARCCFTYVIGREHVCSAWYGRRHFQQADNPIYAGFTKQLDIKNIAYGTKYSQAVTHPSTNLARCCLTYVIGREHVCSAWYGRRHFQQADNTIYARFTKQLDIKNIAYITKYSQAVTHPSTDLARCCLTYVI